MDPELHETLERLHRRIEEQRLGSTHLLNPATLARTTALPQATVEALLRGETPEPEHLDQQIRFRVKARTRTNLAADAQTLTHLANQVHRHLGITRRRARSILNGERTPEYDALPRLAEILRTEGGAEFFTAPPAQVLNRALLAELDQSKTPATIEDVMRQHGVLHTDLRLHGTMEPDQFAQFIGRIVESLNPPTGEKQ
ncbi:hypothetical protein [Streptomyces sp. NPDC000983]|uniref:hypothetical protein n=1 Tax=Streptomyces sp. NPDC000983 TaxID=3154373 RepID=UPI0033260979